VNRVKRLQEKWQGLVDIGAGIWRDGNAGWAEKVVDITDAMEQVEKVELPRARAQTRAERKAAAALRRADPEAYEATRVRIPEGAPAGWVADPEHRARMSPLLLRRIAEDDAREQAQAAREERARAQLAADQQDAAILEQWQRDVALGLATVADLPSYQLEQVGRTKGEALAYYSAEQDAEDARLQAAMVRYGRRVAEAFGADGDKALERLLDGDERVPAGRRQGRERGWG
jgi:hypothetical protein